MKLEDLRNAAIVFQENRNYDGHLDAGAADDMAAGILALTDPTPVDAEWLDARWDRVHNAVAWKIHGFPNLYVNKCGDRFEIQVGPIPVSKHATRGDVLSLLWGLRVPMPEPKGGE